MMAASKPTSRLSGPSHRFPLNHDFGTLAGGLGCFLFTTDVMRVSPVITFSGIRSLHRVVVAGMAPSETVLYPGDSHEALPK